MVTFEELERQKTEMLDRVKVEGRILDATRLGLSTPHAIGLRDRLGSCFVTASSGRIAESRFPNQLHKCRLIQI